MNSYVNTIVDERQSTIQRTVRANYRSTRSRLTSNAHSARVSSTHLNQAFSYARNCRGSGFQYFPTRDFCGIRRITTVGSYRNNSASRAARGMVPLATQYRRVIFHSGNIASSHSNEQRVNLSSGMLSPNTPDNYPGARQPVNGVRDLSRRFQRSHSIQKWKNREFEGPHSRPNVATGFINIKWKKEQEIINKKQVYEPHWSKQQLLNGIEDGSLISGSFRINPKRHVDGYLRHPLGDSDVYIHGLINRNRALPSDLVAVKVEPKKNWRVYDKYTVVSNESNSANLSKKKDRKEYIHLNDFLSRHRDHLEKVIGSSVAQKIFEDLESSTDPPIESTSDAENAIGYLPWWMVIQRTGKVVGIVNALHPRSCVGNLQLPKSTPRSRRVRHSNVVNSNWRFANFVHSDPCLPRLIVHRNDCPKGRLLQSVESPLPAFLLLLSFSLPPFIVYSVAT